MRGGPVLSDAAAILRTPSSDGLRMTGIFEASTGFKPPWHWLELRENLGREIHDRCERLGIKTRSADQRTVQFFLRHQSLNVVRLDAAAV